MNTLKYKDFIGTVRRNDGYHIRIYIAERACFAKGYGRRHTYMRGLYTGDVEITGFIFHTESDLNFVGLKNMQA